MREGNWTAEAVKLNSRIAKISYFLPAEVSRVLDAFPRTRYPLPLIIFGEPHSPNISNILKLSFILKSNWFGKLSLAIAAAGFTKPLRLEYIYVIVLVCTFSTSALAQLSDFHLEVQAGSTRTYWGRTFDRGVLYQPRYGYYVGATADLSFRNLWKNSSLLVEANYRKLTTGQRGSAERLNFKEVVFAILPTYRWRKLRFSIGPSLSLIVDKNKQGLPPNAGTIIETTFNEYSSLLTRLGFELTPQVSVEITHTFFNFSPIRRRTDCRAFGRRCYIRYNYMHTGQIGIRYRLL